MQITDERKSAGNNTCEKLAIQWLNEALSFITNSVLTIRLALRNRQLHAVAKRYVLIKGGPK
jgi:hypothetical protein